MGVALGLTILMQIAYPLVDGNVLQFITITSVLTAALAMFLHGIAAFGARYGWSMLGITLLFGYFIEQLGVSTSWPFGEYSYSSTLGPKLFDVPLVVPFAWVMIAHPCLVAARRIGKSWVFLYGGLLMMAWDLFLDPLMVTAGRWTWVVTGAHVPFQPEIPLSNTFGWLLSGMTLITILHFATPVIVARPVDLWSPQMCFSSGLGFQVWSETCSSLVVPESHCFLVQSLECY